MNFITESAYLGFALSIVAYGIGCLIKSKFNFALCNPLLISIIITIAVLVIGNIDYKVYNSSAKILSWILTTATVCLTVPLYEKLNLLKENWKAIFAGITVGVFSSILCVLAMALALGFSHAEYVTFLPKSITTAIGIGVSEEMNGNPNLTAAIIIITGIAGNVLAPIILKIGRITDPIAKGIAIGSSAHALGTSKAIEMGETEGAMSGLAIGVCGIMTVIVASFFAQFM